MDLWIYGFTDLRITRIGVRNAPFILINMGVMSTSSILMDMGVMNACTRSTRTHDHGYGDANVWGEIFVQSHGTDSRFLGGLKWKPNDVNLSLVTQSITSRYILAE